MVIELITVTCVALADEFATEEKCQEKFEKKNSLLVTKAKKKYLTSLN